MLIPCPHCGPRDEIEFTYRGDASVVRPGPDAGIEAWDDYLWWQQQDRRIVRRINELIEASRRDPFSGIGKPEPLRHALAGYWSRRITDEHRMVYRDSGALLIAQLRYHY